MPTEETLLTPPPGHLCQTLSPDLKTVLADKERAQYVCESLDVAFFPRQGHVQVLMELGVMDLRTDPKRIICMDLEGSPRGQQV